MTVPRAHAARVAIVTGAAGGQGAEACQAPVSARITGADIVIDGGIRARI